jgi:peroxiredoxin
MRIVPLKGDKPVPRVQLDAIAPDFTLEDFRGRVVRLSDYRDNKHVILVFNRGFV